MRSTRSADVSHRDKKGRITKASGETNITPSVNTNPSLAAKARTDMGPDTGSKLLTNPVG